jgi:hypothetical protein
MGVIFGIACQGKRIDLGNLKAISRRECSDVKEGNGRTMENVSYWEGGGGRLLCVQFKGKCQENYVAGKDSWGMQHAVHRS